MLKTRSYNREALRTALSCGLTIPLLVSCGTSGGSPGVISGDRAAVAPEVRQAAIDEMRPTLECVFFYNNIGLDNKATEGIDTAVTIGEEKGLSISQIMSSYRTLKTEVEEAVLEEAIRVSKERPSRLPRIGGDDARLQPLDADEDDAWLGLYEEQCSDS